VFTLYLPEGKIEPEVVENMQTWPNSGFSIDQSVLLSAGKSPNQKLVVGVGVLCGQNGNGSETHIIGFYPTLRSRSA